MRKIADIIATGQRVAEINKFCQRQADSAFNMHANAYFISDSQSSGGSRSLGPGGDSRHSQILATSSTEETVRITNLTVECPAQDGLKTTPALIESLSLSVKAFENLMITGENGVGKTSLIRVCSGLWRRNYGDISLPTRTMFIPQLPILTDGTLKTQVTYPFNSTSITDKQVQACHAKLEKIMGRLNDEDRWEDFLSVGEQQKLMLARVFLQKPNLVFLDESTSALPEEDELAIYDKFLEFKIQFISVAHRTNVRRFHQKLVHLKSDGTYVITDL